MNKKECNIVQDLLLSYADGVLSEESKKLVELHLKDCKECSDRLQEIQEDIKNTNDNQKEQIDYLKKVKRKNRIKAIGLALTIILIIVLGIYLYRLRIFMKIGNDYNQAIQSENFYTESRSISDGDSTGISKRWYKDGNYKEEIGLYTDDGFDVFSVTYGVVNSDKSLVLSPKEKKAVYYTSHFKTNKQSVLFAPFVYALGENIPMRLSTAFTMDISTDTYSVGKPYYVLKHDRWEMWIDKETSLPIREINHDGFTEFYPNSDVEKRTKDSTTQYQYTFDIVTDNDVTIPDLTGYEITEEVMQITNVDKES